MWKYGSLSSEACVEMLAMVPEAPAHGSCLLQLASLQHQKHIFHLKTNGY